MADQNLNDVISDLNKHFGKNTIISGDSVSSIKLDRVSTGSIALDIEIGGGLPYGRVVELFGKESTGKSYIAMQTAINVQKDGKSVVWIDVEGSFDPVWATTLGLDVSKIYLARPESGEAACNILEAVIRSGDCGLAVLDSTAALVPEKDLDTSMEDCEQIGNRAKMVNRLVRKLHSALNMRVGESKLPNNCLVIFINQIREKIGVMFGSPDTTPGGLGLRHAASIRVHFRKSWFKDPKDKNVILGQTVPFVVEKNKTFPPRRRGEFVFYTVGDQKGKIDTAREVLAYGLLTGVIEKASSTSYQIGDSKIVGAEKAIVALREDEKLLEDYKNQIFERFKEKTGG